MHHTREDAERVLAAATAANGAEAPPVAGGGVKDEESETPAATGAKDPDKGKAEHIGAAPAGSPKNQADASVAGGKDSERQEKRTSSTESEAAVRCGVCRRLDSAGRNPLAHSCRSGG